MHGYNEINRLSIINPKYNPDKPVYENSLTNKIVTNQKEIRDVMSKFKKKHTIKITRSKHPIMTSQIFSTWMKILPHGKPWKTGSIARSRLSLWREI